MTYEARIKQLEEELAVKIEELARISAELGDLRSLACRVRLAGGLAGAQQMSQVCFLHPHLLCYASTDRLHQPLWVHCRYLCSPVGEWLVLV